MAKVDVGSMTELRFRVLGPVEALRGGRPVRLGGRASVNLLAGLLMSANQPVNYDALASMVWGNRPPTHPHAALHNLKFRLQRTLGEDVIQTVSVGYQITISDQSLDLLYFDRLLDAVDAALRANSLHRAAAAIDEALSLWRLPVLANVRSDALLREGASVLVERYLDAQERRAALQVRLGRYQEVAAELGRVVLAHPFREALVGLLMLALYRSNRQADALAAYHQLRQDLRDGLGVDPSADLQELYKSILRGEDEVDQPKAFSMLEMPRGCADGLSRGAW
jgi:DNA-binding SARP family transcriptional activator